MGKWKELAGIHTCHADCQRPACVAARQAAAGKERTMTDRELMQMALDAMRAVSVDEHLCNAAHHIKKDRHGIDEPCPIAKRFNDIAEALRARLAQPEPEPVAWMHDSHVGFNVPLYTALPQRDETPAKAVEWQGLTDGEIEKLYLGSFDEGQFARAIEAKLKEKNT